MKIRCLVSVLIFVLVASAGLFAQTPPANSPVARHGRLSVSNSQIVNQSGEPVQLRGMSYYWSVTSTGFDFYNANVVGWLASDWKVDVVRAAMGVERDFWTDQQGYINNPEANRNRVLAVVQGAIDVGIYVIIDWHSYVAEASTPRAIAFFEDMAERYKDVPNVIFEIYNEPNGSNGEHDGVRGQVSPNNRQTPWATIKNNHMQPVTNAIRAKGANNLILIGTPNWCQRPDVAADDPVTGENLVYTAHYYAGQNSSDHRAILRDRIYYTMGKGFAVFISEFGLTGASGDGALNLDEAALWFDFLDQFKIGWANWGIGTWDQTSAALRAGASASGNWNADNLTESGAYIRGRLRALPSSEAKFFTVTVNTVGEGSVNRRPTIQVFDKGRTVTLTAVAASGWRFAGWSGDLTGDAAETAFTIERDMVVTATFQSASSTVTADAARAAAWSVRRVNGRVSLRGPSAGDVSFYDVMGRLTGRFGYSGGVYAPISASSIPSGNYMMVVRDRGTGREVYKTRVSLVD